MRAQLSKEESLLDFASSSAATLHNAVRGLAGWPGTVARVELVDDDAGEARPSMEVVIAY